jgi:chaperonin GroEL
MIVDQIKRRTELTDVALLISDLDIEEPRDLMPVLDLVMEAGIRTLLIVAGRLSESSIALLLAASREPEKFRVIAVHTPGSGIFEQAAAMEDLGVLTGGRPLLKAAGDSLRRLTVADLGHARRAWSERSNFGLVGGKGDARRLRAHIATLRQALSATSESGKQATLRQRIGKLMGGSATLLIGGHAEIETTAREELARRTAGLLRAALTEGVVPGGGSTFLACRSRLQHVRDTSTDPDEQAAYSILIRALEEPFRTIVTNAGYDVAPVLAEVNRADEGFGFDVRREAVVDMAQAGIVDIAAAQKAVIRGVITAAALALTVDTLVHKRNPAATPGRP